MADENEIIEANQADDTADFAPDTPVADELAVLKDRARLLGVEFSNNIKLETLRERVAKKLAENADPMDEVAQDEDEQEQNPLGTTPPKPRKKTLREELMESQMALVRCRITNLDPKKKDLPGEIFTVANEYIGTVRKFVPFGEVTDEGYHIPFCIYTMLEERRFQDIRTVKDRRTGTSRVQSTWAKEFAIEVLPQLTEAELHALAAAQAAAGSVAGSAEANYL